MDIFELDVPSGTLPVANMGLHFRKKQAKPNDDATEKEPWSKQATVYFRLLFSPGYTTNDILLLVGGLLGACASGVPFPLLAILFGQLIDDLNTANCTETSGNDPSGLTDSVRQKVVYIVYVTIANWCFIYIHTTCWSLFGERLVRRIRERYLRSLLRQDLAFFDGLPAGDVSSRLSIDLEDIQKGTSEKVGIVLGSVSYFAAAYTVAFLKYPRLAAILISLLPAYCLLASVGSYFVKGYTSRVSDHLAMATSIASESLNKLNIVHAFGAGARLESKFADFLGKARTEGMKKALTVAVQLGSLYFIVYSTNALSYWQGSRGIAESVLDGGTSAVGAVYTVIFVLIDASFILSQVAPFMQLFGTAAGASEKLNKTIARKSKIDGTDRRSGERLQHVQGGFEFDNIAFAYPSRPDTDVVKDFSISIPALKHTAIVGQSGSGKSTLAALMARLYDPGQGVIRLDGVDIRGLNVGYLRGCIGAVQQDPALLDRSILENIAHGLINSDANQDEVDVVLHGELAVFTQKIRKGASFDSTLAEQSATFRSVVERARRAATIADATGFIARLDHGLATSVGSAGSKFSGGQKQRIALARAMMRDPKILLLDEATSALDSRSERLIQGALQEASKGRTTISIVHRLSTVKEADNIVVMRSGRVVEQGSHPELMATDGVYASMVRLQNVSRHDDTAASDQASDQAAVENSEDDISSVENRTSNDTLDEKKSAIDEKPMPATSEEKKRDSTDKGKTDKENKTTSRGVWSTIAGIGTLTRSQALWLLVAFAAATIVGGSYSAEAVIFGHTISSFSACNTPADILSAGSFWGLLFFVLAIVEFLANLTMSWFFARVGEYTVYKIRILSFRTLTGQDLQWHESDGRDPSSLLAYITSDANDLAGLTGPVLGTLFSIIVNTFAGLILSLVIAWRIAIVLVACVPILLSSGIMRLRCFKQFHEKHAKAFSSATGYAVESVNSIRVISIFSLEEEAVNTYHRSLQEPYRETLKMLLWSNCWLATAYSVSNLVYALAYWWGSRNIIEGRYSQRDFFIVLPALLFSAQTCGQLFALAPDFSKSRVSAARILDLLDIGKQSQTVSRKAIVSGPFKDDDSEDDIESGIGGTEKPMTGTSGAAVKFNSVEFSYPARPDQQVLRGLDIDIKPGQFCALVGPSGAGKSTIISLVERFYRPSSGTVMIDGRNVGELTTADFRQDIAFVPQESTLFEGTLKFNISLGARPNVSVSDAEIEAACRLAHIHDTIVALPDGYNTRCGPNGNQFSGGQRQRISIARALLRKPRLLLLDESTSALDSESEKMVQDALENIRKGVTVIAIAHRLHTIEKADRIFVIEDGVCTAKGTHRELLTSSETYRTNALHQALGQ